MEVTDPSEALPSHDPPKHTPPRRVYRSPYLLDDEDYQKPRRRSGQKSPSPVPHSPLAHDDTITESPPASPHGPSPASFPASDFSHGSPLAQGMPSPMTQSMVSIPTSTQTRRSVSSNQAMVNMAALMR